MQPATLIVVDHPLVVHYLTVLRDRRTEVREYRDASRRITRLLVAEAVADLPVAPVEIETPMEGGFMGGRLGKPTVLAPVLRAGVGMLDGALDVLGESSVGYVGLQRDPETVQPVGYYSKFPDLAGARVLVLEPMLATGGSLAKAVDLVKEAGGEDIVCLCMVTCPPGAETMARRHPDTPVLTAGHDRGLDPNSYILPGLGDMGDRLFGTPH
ncbi:MAG: uracil phosphoribosyltransferase [Acidimicrobiia bacterium]|nr:uracil phosphoribosyltransferase [Acidimicrobiia bacterium]